MNLRRETTMGDDLQQYLDALESERGSNHIDELVERLDESGLTQSEIQKMVRKANERDSVVALPPKTEKV